MCPITKKIEAEVLIKDHNSVYLRQLYVHKSFRVNEVRFRIENMRQFNTLKKAVFTWQLDPRLCIASYKVRTRLYKP